MKHLLSFISSPVFRSFILINLCWLYSVTATSAAQRQLFPTIVERICSAAETPTLLVYQLDSCATYKYLRPSYWPAPDSIVLSSNTQQADTGLRYVSFLVNKQFAESWAMVGLDIKDKMSYDQYVVALTPILNEAKSGKKNVSLTMSGPLVTATDQNLIFYNYAVKAQKADAPPLMIRILFKNLDEQLISGIQPRQVVSMSEIKLSH